MRGTILGYNDNDGTGAITTPDGTRHDFGAADWKGATRPRTGQIVDFNSMDGRAVDIYPMPGGGPLLEAATSTPEGQAQMFGVLSLGSALLTMMLGPLGLLTAAAAIFFGLKGRRASVGLTDRLGYYLSMGGLILGGIMMAFAVIGILAFFGVVGALMWGSWLH